MKQRSLVFAAAVVLSCPGSAAAQEPAPSNRVVRGQLGVSVNNAGMQNTIEVTWRAGDRVSAGVIHALTPAQTRFGGWIRYSPFQFLEIRAGVEPSAYFGTFNSLQGFASYEDAFDREARDVRAGAKPGLSVRSFVAPALKLKAGPIAFASTVEVERWRSSAGSPLFYEPTRDTLLTSNGGRATLATSVLLYQPVTRSGSLSVGAVHSLLDVPAARRNRVQKLGAIAIRELERPFLKLPHPRLTVTVVRYLEDPSKQGEWSGAIAIGFRTGR